MDLLQDYNKSNKNKKTKGQKIVLALLIISIILFFAMGIGIVYFEMEKSVQTYKVAINGREFDTTELDLIITENGDTYIPVRGLCEKLNFQYKNGEYQIPGEDFNKGYIDNNLNIIQIFGESIDFYKTTEETKLDYEYYTLKKEILQIEEKLYIEINDLPAALNLIVEYTEEKNQTSIKTPEYFIEEQSKKLQDANISISDIPENKKALAYGYMIIKKDDKYGVTSLNNIEIIGNKYNSIVFLENTKDFVVSNNNNKLGIIDIESKIRVNLQYDSIEILNHNPLLYKVEKLKKFGIMTEEGNILNEIEYDHIGYKEDASRGINYTLIIPKLNEKIPNSIVVCKDSKYGLIDLQNGSKVLDCNLKAIYSATDQSEKIYYIVETEEQKVFLENYINSLNRIIVNY